jgi:hypothetical protein
VEGGTDDAEALIFGRGDDGAVVEAVGGDSILVTLGDEFERVESVNDGVHLRKYLSLGEVIAWGS